MVKETFKEEIHAPPALPRFISDMLFIAGVLIYIVWTALYLVPQNKYFDIGLFSICAVITLFGLIGHYHYKNVEEMGASQ
ncbi:MAG: hypothetical protein J7L88_06670 [Thermoplasmata archaeon]|nr:hypothetical protein [Thermoplasmata archaeon]